MCVNRCLHVTAVVWLTLFVLLFAASVRAETDYLSEYFIEIGQEPNPFDLDGKSLIYIPDGSQNYYRLLVREITALPTDPAAANATDLDWAFYDEEIELSNGDLPFFGRTYQRVFVSGSGLISYGQSTPTLAYDNWRHLDYLRAVPFGNYLDPDPGQIVWQEFPDRLVITYLAVKLAGTDEENTFQAELFRDGRVVFSYLGMASQRALVGVSAGEGRPAPNPSNSDLSNYPSLSGRHLGISTPLPGAAFEAPGLLDLAWTAFPGSAWSAGKTVLLQSSDDGGATWRDLEGANDLPFDQGVFSLDFSGWAGGDYLFRAVATDDAAVVGQTYVPARLAQPFDGFHLTISEPQVDEAAVLPDFLIGAVDAGGIVIRSFGKDVTAGRFPVTVTAPGVQVAGLGGPGNELGPDDFVDGMADLAALGAYIDAEPAPLETRFTCTSADGKAGTSDVLTIDARPDYFTEAWLGRDVAADLEGLSVIFVPDGSEDFYKAYTRAIQRFPTDTAGADIVNVTNSDAVGYYLGYTMRIPLYGTEYDHLIIGPNGSITFDWDDYDQAASLEHHFSQPRISGLLNNYALDQGQVLFQRFDDRVVVTFDGVRWNGSDGTDSTSFQIEMYTDGRIVLSYLRIEVESAVAGLSAGNGLPDDFTPSDLSAFPPPPGRNIEVRRPWVDDVYHRGDLVSIIWEPFGTGWGPTDTVSVQYRLEGRTDWHPVANGLPFSTTVAHLDTTGLSPGQYRFRVMPDSQPDAARLSVAPVPVLGALDHFEFTMHSPIFDERPLPGTCKVVALDAAGQVIVDFDEIHYRKEFPVMLFADGARATNLAAGGNALLPEDFDRGIAWLDWLGMIPDAASVPNVTRFYAVSQTGARGMSNEVNIVSLPDRLTEFFAGEGRDDVFDLENTTLVFTPDQSLSAYSVTCNNLTADELPNDMTGGTQIVVQESSDDPTTVVTPSRPIPFFGIPRTVLYINASGNISFGEPHRYYSSSPIEEFFFDVPQAVPLMRELQPANGAEILYKEFVDRLVVHVNDPRQVYHARYQVELFFDGRIVFHYLNIDVTGTQVGLSAGEGLPFEFEESDFSSFPPGIRELDIWRPNPADVADIGSAVPVRWLIRGGDWLPSDTVRLEYVAGGARGWQAIPGADSIAYDQLTYDWDTAGLDPDPGYRVRVIFNDDPSVQDEINEPISLIGPLDHFQVTVPTPQANGWTLGYGAQIEAYDAANQLVPWFGENPDTKDFPVVLAAPQAAVTMADGSPATLGPEHFAHGRADLATIPIYATADTVPHTAEFAATSAGGISGVSTPVEFTTPRPYLFEVFDGAEAGDPFDLAFTSLTFVPDGSPGAYSVYKENITQLPSSDLGWTYVGFAQSQDDGSMEVAATPGVVRLYGQQYSSIFVGENGYVTFAGPDHQSVPIAHHHFAVERVSAMFYDFHPSTDYRDDVLRKRFEDHHAIKFHLRRAENSGPTCDFLAAFYDDGRIVLQYGSIGIDGGLVGLSQGNGVPTDVGETDLSAAAPMPARLLWVVAPHGGETVAIGEMLEISWATLGGGWLAGDRIALDYSSDGGTSWVNIEPSLAFEDGRFEWDTTGLPPGDSYRVRVRFVDDPGVAGTSFGDLALIGGLDHFEWVVDSPQPNGRRISGQCRLLALDEVGQPLLGFGNRGNGDAFPIVISASQALVTGLSGPGGDELNSADFTAGAADLAALGMILTTGNPGTVTALTATSAEGVIGVSGPVELGDCGTGMAEYFEGPDSDGDEPDLQQSRLSFYPGTGGDEYTAYRHYLGDDAYVSDYGTKVSTETTGFAPVPLEGGAVFPFYGTDYDTVYVGRHGYLTFGQGDSTTEQSMSAHFALPRISICFHDLANSEFQSLWVENVYWRQEDDRLVVSYIHEVFDPRFPGGQFPKPVPLNFQAELFFDGRIALTYEGVLPLTAIVGLSRGTGLPECFLETDFDALSGRMAALPGLQRIYYFAMDEDPGWVAEGDWEFGPPAGNDGDPNQAFSGVNVYGYNLDGKYPDDLDPAEYLIAGPFDLSQWQDVKLRFAWWLAVEEGQYDNAAIEVSDDGGTTWQQIWGNPEYWNLESNHYEIVEFDLDELAASRDNVYVRWAMGPTDEGVTFAGWTIDDVEIWGAPRSETSELEVASIPSGVEVTVNGISGPTPLTGAGFPNTPVLLSYPAQFDRDDVTYVLDHLLDETGLERTAPPVEYPFFDSSVTLVYRGQPHLDLTHPVGFEHFQISNDVAIEWTTAGQDWQPGDEIRAELSADGGGTWQVIPGGDQLPYDGSPFYWDTAGLQPGDDYRIRLSGRRLDGLADVSDAPFRLAGDPDLTSVIPARGPGGTRGLLNGLLLGSDPGQVIWRTPGTGDLQCQILDWSPGLVRWRLPLDAAAGAGELIVIIHEVETAAIPFEVLSPLQIAHVDDSNDTAVENGSTEYPFARISDAVNAAADPGTVKVAQGWYDRPERIRNRSVFLRGGYGGQETYGGALRGADFGDATRDPARFSTVIDGKSRDGDPCVLFFNVPDGELSGFEIQNGLTDNDGAGVKVQESAVVVSHNLIHDNRGTWLADGGGVALIDSPDAVVEWNRIYDNRGGSGGGVVCEGGGTVRFNHIARNVGGAGGGVCSHDRGTAAIHNNVIADNQAGWGSGIACEGGGAHIYNNTIVNNWSEGGMGGGIAVGTSQDTTPPADVWNCIIWGNDVHKGDQIATLSADAVLTVDYCCFPNGQDDVYQEDGSALELGPENIHVDPMFAHPDWDWPWLDLHLKSAGGHWFDDGPYWVLDAATSPCIDAGNPNSDYNLEPEPNGGRVNIGAYGGTEEASRSGLPAPVMLTVDTSPSGPDMEVRVDGVPHTPPYGHPTYAGVGHFIDVTSPQGEGQQGVRDEFDQWSDSGGQGHTVRADFDTTHTAFFETAYRLTLTVLPAAAESAGCEVISVTAGREDGWYRSGTEVTLSATSADGWLLDQWSNGEMTASMTLRMDGPADVHAAFGEAQYYDLALPPGWSLFSLPIGPRPAAADQIAAGRNGSARAELWGWQPESGAYCPVDGPAGETGYWYFNPDAQPHSVRLQGVELQPVSLQLAAGWHLIGPRIPTAFSSSRDLAGRAWYWHAASSSFRSLSDSEEMQPGWAYWVRADEDGGQLDLP